MAGENNDPAADRRTDGLVLVPGRRHRLGDQLYGQILDQIVSGRLKEGERLPAETEICEMFGVSRPIVREALLRLRADGLLQARQGAGTYVAARPADRLKAFTSTGEVAGFLRCIELRLPIEGTAARLAAERRTPAQMARIEATHARFEQDLRTGTVMAESDLAFHASIIEASGNDLFLTVFDEVRPVIRGFMQLSLNLTRTGTKKRASQVLEEHVRIVDAIRAENPEAAQSAMQLHIDQARLRMVDRGRDG
jgi:GntR family transcriptional repressor for pyruvate dehydrogenase complex